MLIEICIGEKWIHSNGHIIAQVENEPEDK